MIIKLTATDIICSSSSRSIHHRTVDYVLLNAYVCFLLLFLLLKLAAVLVSINNSI